MIPIRDLNPSRSFAFINLLLILLNIIVWIYELTLSPQELERFFYTYGVVPSNILNNPLSLITYMFLHGGWLHITGNMVYLWVFGDNVEDRLGHLRYLLFYLSAGIFAALVQSLIALGFGNPHVPLIGASGAIAGVLGAYTLFFPSAKVFGFIPFFIFLIPVEWPAAVFIGIWFIFQIVNGLIFLPFAKYGGIAWFAHIGGFLFGYLAALKFKSKREQNTI